MSTRSGMRWPGLPALAALLALSCTSRPDGDTLASLREVEPDRTPVRVRDGLDQAMLGYRTFLEEAPKSELTPEALRRLADLKLEKEYGALGDAASEGIAVVELAAPEAAPPASAARDTGSGPDIPSRAPAESAADFERRATARVADLPAGGAGAALALPGGASTSGASGPLEAIDIYDQILARYPSYAHNDQVLYQKARALDELGRIDEAIGVMERLIAEYPRSSRLDEVQFRRAEYFFTRRRYLDAEAAYQAAKEAGASGEFYELALYKLGWTFYKQDYHEEALAEYVTLLDHKVASGYDFAQTADEGDQRRIADTYRVISLSFSILGGPEAVVAFFDARGSRSYEHHIYRQLGEFYLDKLRYHDAARSYQAFVDRYPLHASSPEFGMRIVEVHETGEFPRLVLEAKKDFAARYGTDAEYWRHFDIEAAPEVVAHLKTNLEDLASHYHAVYQDEESEDRPASFREALRWYRAFLASFPDAPETAPLHHRMADLLLEHGDFGPAAMEYERVAYERPAHAASADAGYAAVWAHRKHEERREGSAREAARRAAVKSSLRFADTFPTHEHAAAVLGAAVDDLYQMADHARAIERGRALLAGYPEAPEPIRRSAWTAIAHASFDSEAFADAEGAYRSVLDLTTEGDEKRSGVADNLAAAIYKQAEAATQREDHRAAAEQFLKVARDAPESEIRPLAEYDAAVSLIRLEDWDGAADVLEAFRASHPDHELAPEATRQLAFVHRESGRAERAAAEYERVADEAEDPALRAEALLAAVTLYEESGATERLLAVSVRYVEAFPEPVETAVETRFRIAELYADAGDDEARRGEFERIVEIDRASRAARTPRVRYLAARSALALAEPRYHHYAAARLVQPFDASLVEKQRRMAAAEAAFTALLDYEVGEVTAAATFYLGEISLDFGRALVDSERPEGLSPEQRDAYELALDEEAFPFEEAAIEIHQKNLELATDGLYNEWVARSVGRLAELVPGRYAKREVSSGWITAADRWVYVPPNGRSSEAAAASVPAAAAEIDLGDELDGFSQPEDVHDATTHD